jgi:Predicted membrane protein (DUF2231)
MLLYPVANRIAGTHEQGDRPPIHGELWRPSNTCDARSIPDRLLRRRLYHGYRLLALDVIYLGDVFGLVADGGAGWSRLRCDRRVGRLRWDRRIRQLRSAWIHALGNGLVIVLSVINVFVHSRDGYTAVVPTGIVLSGGVVLIMIITGWLGGELVYRHRVGVTE